VHDRASLAQVTTLVFDVMGTVVDVDAAIHRAASSVLADAGVDDAAVAEFVEDGKARLQRLMDDVIAGAIPWCGHQDLRRTALAEAVVASGIEELSAAAIATLTSVIHRSPPWPDSAGALDRLRIHRNVVALSNADLDELLDLSRLGGLSWHGVISTAVWRSFKPDPAVYRNTLQMLAADPGSIMMVAAHPWDLRAAAEHGMATAFIARPAAEAPRADDDFDLTVNDLAELADRLAV
jgi:2-haloacid dehalogenase